MGRTTTFLLDSRQVNLDFACATIDILCQIGYSGAIIDLDAFYSSNSERIFRPLDRSAAEATAIHVPEPRSDIMDEFSTFFGVHQRVIIIDSLNTLYHLISLDDGSSRGRKMAFAVASLSYFARTNAKAVLLTMYRREGLTRGGPGRPIATLSDAAISVDTNGQELILMSDRGSDWPGRRFSIRIPSE